MQLVWDALRGLVLAEFLFILLGVAVAVWSAQKEKANLNRDMLAHVTWLAVGLAILIVGYASYTIDQLGAGTPKLYGSPPAFLGASIILVGLFHMRRYQKTNYPTETRPKPETPTSISTTTIVLFAIAMFTSFVGFYQTTVLQSKECNRNNGQDAVLRDLLTESTTDEARVKQGQEPLTPDERVALNKFLHRLRGQKCPSKGL